MASKTFFAAAAAAILMMAASRVGAQPQPKLLEVKADTAFRHAHTRVELPPRVAGLARSRVLELEPDQLDTVVDYSAPDLGSAYTFYIYRNVAGSLPIWFDRAAWMIEHRDALGAAAHHGVAAAFVPPERREAAGLIATYDLSGKDFRSTGVALVPLGEWYVKLRASSKTLSAAELEAGMKAALAELRWPKSGAALPTAVPVEPCPEPLTFRGDARPLPRGDKAGATALFNALLGAANASGIKDKKAKPERRPVWCRDAAQSVGGGAYRPDGDRSSYLYALGDAGRALWVGRDPAQALLQADGVDPGDKPAYLVQLLLLPQTVTSGGYDRLPPPEQALRIAKDGPFASSVPTWGKAKGNIQISSGALK